jgi:type VI secretion system secreted protein Hcp
MTRHQTTRRTLIAGSVGGTALGGLLMAGDAEASVTVPTGGGAQYFLDLDGIAGESQDSEFPGTFEILDFSYGATTSLSPVNTGSGASKVKPRDMSFTKLVDKSSPTLFKACCTGRHIKSATLHVRKSNAKQEYLKIELENVFISSYSSAPNSSDGIPLDVVTLSYGEFEIDYTAQDPAGGAGRTYTAAFDFLKNRVV